MYHSSYWTIGYSYIGETQFSSCQLIFLDIIISCVNQNFLEIEKNEDILTNLFDNITQKYHDIYSDIKKRSKPIILYEFLLLFDKNYGIIKKEKSDLIIYDIRKKIYFHWTDNLSERGILLTKKYNRNISGEEYMGELFLFFLELFMSAKIYRSYTDMLNKKEYNDNMSYYSKYIGR
jgi:hypothetical protein